MLRTLNILAVIIYVIIITTLCLIPMVELPGVRIWDKAAHAISYVGFVFIAGPLARNNREFMVLLGICFIYGAGIEILQGFTGYRSFSLLDQTANTLGLVTGAILFNLMKKIFALLFLPNKM